MGEEDSLMFSEAAASGQAVRLFLGQNRMALAALGSRLRTSPPQLAITCARGSSDHAATFAKYLFETRLSVPTASAAFSTVSLYGAQLGRGARFPLCLAVSQSGRSPDLLATVSRVREAGALTVSLVNDADSPLAAMTDVCLPLCAGPELSVAATKSYITSLAGIAAIVAEWQESETMRAVAAQLPDAIDAAFALDWSPARETLTAASSLFVISRGYGLAIAQEAALKLKETCGLHAEAFSSAEVRHGPMAIVRKGFPVLAFDAGGAAGEDVRAVCNEFAQRGANVWLATTSQSPADGAEIDPAVQLLPAVSGLHDLSVIPMIASFYRLANSVSLARGLNPDNPPFLAKVTRTR